MARYGRYMAIYQLLFFGSLTNLHVASGYIWGHNFWTNQDLDPLSTSKGPPELQFCEKYTHIWRKMASNGCTKVIYKETFVSKQSLGMFTKCWPAWKVPSKVLRRSGRRWASCTNVRTRNVVLSRYLPHPVVEHWLQSPPKYPLECRSQRSPSNRKNKQ